MKMKTFLSCGLISVGLQGLVSHTPRQRLEHTSGIAPTTHFMVKSKIKKKVQSRYYNTKETIGCKKGTFWRMDAGAVVFEQFG